MHQVRWIQIKGSETSIAIAGWTCEEGGRDKPRGSSLLITFSASPRVSAPYSEAGLQVCSPFPSLSPIAACGVLAMHLGVSQLSTAALPEGRGLLAWDQPSNEQRQRGTLPSFAQAQLLKMKQTTSPQLEPPTLPGHGSSFTKVKCS